MIFGIRPEHLTETHEGSKANMAPLAALVDVTEPMGMETMVHFFIDGTPVCARVDPTVRAEPGEVMPLSADMSNMHLIEPDSGRVV